MFYTDEQLSMILSAGEAAYALQCIDDGYDENEQMHWLNNILPTSIVDNTYSLHASVLLHQLEIKGLA